MWDELGAVIAGVAAGIASVLTYLAAFGKNRNDAALRLTNEQIEFRKSMAEQLARQSTEIAALQAQHNRAEERADKYMLENADMKTRLQLAEHRIAELAAQVMQRDEKIRQLQEHINGLERRKMSD